MPLLDLFFKAVGQANATLPMGTAGQAMSPELYRKNAVNADMDAAPSGDTYVPVPRTYAPDLKWVWIVLAYASEIWQMTMARRLEYTPQVYSVPSGLTFMDPGLGDVQFCVVQLEGDTEPYEVTVSNPRRGKYGWFCAVAFGNSGLLQPISFTQQQFFPEQQGMTGFKISLPPRVTGTVTMYYRPTGSSPLQTQNGADAILMDGITDGIDDDSTGETIQAEYTGYTATIVTQDSVTDEYDAEDAYEYFLTTADDASCGEAIWRNALMSYLCETWQILCTNQAYNVETAAELSETTLIMAHALRHIMTFDIDCTETPESPDHDFGQTGFKYFGWVSFLYEHGQGTIQFINDTFTTFIANGYGAIGIMVYLKVGVTCSYQKWERNNRAVPQIINGVAVTMIDGGAPQL